MKRLAFALAGLLIVTLCFTVARHISDAVMTVIVGVVMGVGASVIPTVLILGGYDEMEKQRTSKRRDYDATARQVTVNIYGPVAIGPGARAGMAGAQPPQWRQLPARDGESPTVLYLPGGER